MPGKRFLPVVLIGTWWILLVVLAWQSGAGLYRPAYDSFACLADFALPPAGILARHYLLMLAAALGFVLAFMALSGAGRAALDWLKPPILSRVENAAVGALAGFGLFCTAIFALGLSGLLLTPVMIAAWAVILLIAISPRPAWPSLSAPARVEATNGPIAAVAVIMLAVLAAFSLAPETTVDALVYHLGAPAYFGSIHRIADAPQLEFRWPLLTEIMLCSVPGVIGPWVYRAGGMMLLVLLMFGWIRRRWGETAALLGTLFLLSSPGNATLATVVKPDLYASAYVLLAIVIMDRAPAVRGLSGTAAALCGASLGWAFAAKETTVAVVAGFIAWDLARSRSISLRRVLLGAAGFGAVAAPFLVRSWLSCGNPVYPFLFGGLGWSETSSLLAMKGYPSPDIIPGDPAATAATLARFLAAEALPALFGLALLFYYRSGRRPAGYEAGPAIWAAAFVAAQVWIFRAPYMRFILPVLPVLYALGAAGLARLMVPGRRIFGLALAGCLLLPGFVRVIALANLSGPEPKLVLPASIGLELPNDFRHRDLTGYWRAVVRARTLNAGPGRLLLVGDARGALFSPDRVTLTQDIPDFSLVLAAARESWDADGIRKRFRQYGISAVGLNYLASSQFGMYYTGLGKYWQDGELRRYYAFFSRFAEQVGKSDRYDIPNGGFTFFRIRKRASSSAGTFDYLPGTEGLAWNRPGESPAEFADRMKNVVAIAPTIYFFRYHLKTDRNRMTDARR
jgi:hypothetical protein